MNWGQLLFSFEGRVGRGVYWGFFVVVLVLMGLFLGSTIMAMMSSMSAGADPAAVPTGGGVMGMVGALISLALIWPSLASQALARCGQVRMVDSDQPGACCWQHHRAGLQRIHPRHAGAEPLR